MIGRRRPRPPERSEAGLALLSALLSVALLTIIVVELADSTLVHAHLSRNTGNAIAAQFLARSAINAAEAMLIQDGKDDSGRTGPNQYWSTPLPPIPTRNGSVAFNITDEGGKLDLNRVADAKYRPVLEALFEDLDVDVQLLDAVQAWTSKDLEVAARAVTQYCALPMPCESRPKQRTLASLDDLRVIRGFDEQVLRKLEPYVTALPANTQKGVNVNTAEARVWTALGCESGSSSKLPPGGYEKNDAIAGCESVDKSLLAVKSDVFSITAFGNVGDVSQGVRTIVQRKGNKVLRLTWRERPVSAVRSAEVP